MSKFALLILSFISISFQVNAFELKSVEGRWKVDSISMVGLGDMPAGDGDFFIFDGNVFKSISTEAADSTAPFVIRENKIVISYPDRVEKLNITELTSKKMVFILEVYKGDKKISADNMIFTLIKQ